MAIAFVSSATNQNKTSSGTIGLASIYSVSADASLIACIVFDNATATTPQVTDITKHPSETNNWSRIAYFDSPQSAAGGGLRGEMWRLDTTTVSNIAHSASLSGNVTAKAIIIFQFTGLGALDGTPQTHSSSSGSTTLTMPFTPAGGVNVWMIGTENNAVPGRTAGAAIAITASNGTTGGSAVTNVWEAALYLINATSRTETWNSTDGGMISAQFQPAPTGTTYQVAGTVAVTTNATGDATAWTPHGVQLVHHISTPSTDSFNRPVHLGAPSPERKIVVAIMSQSTLTDPDIDASLDGTLLTLVRAYDSRNRIWIYEADWPTGTLGVLTYDSTSPGTNHVYVWALYDGAWSRVDEQAALTTSGNRNIVTVANDAILAATMGWSNTAPPSSWTGVTEDANEPQGTNWSAAAHAIASGGPTTAVGVTWPTPSGTTLWAGSYRMSAPPQQVSGTVAVVTNATGAVTANLRASGTVPVVVGATGAVTARMGVSGTVPVVVGVTGDATRAPQNFQVSGTVAVVTAATGDATVQAGSQQYQVSGTVPVVTAASGSVSANLSAAGTVPVVTTATGAATRVPLTLQVSGTVAVVTNATGTVALRQQVSGTVPVVTVATGAVTQKLQVSGTIPVVTTAVGDASLVGGAQTYPVSGTVAVVTTAAGTIGSQSLAVSGTAAVVTSATGDATRVPITFQVSGTVAVQTAVSGTVTAKLPVSGTVPVAVNATGAITSRQGVSGTVAVVTNATGSAFPPGGMQGTVPVVTTVTGSVTSRQGISGTPVAVTVGVSGAVTAKLPTSGTAPVTVGVSGTVSQVHQVSGTVAVTTAATGDATRSPVTFQVSGTVPVVTAATGNVALVGGAQQYQVSGTVAVTTNATGTITKRSQVAGTAAVVTAASGTVSARMRVSGTVPVTTAAVGAISARYPVSGTVIVLTSVSGFIYVPEPPPFPCDGLTLVPSGPFMPLAGSTPLLTLQMEVDRLPLSGEAEGYSVTKTAERLTLEGVC
jgi:hypothetical protein